jgi:hypothetical protein
MLPQPPGPDPDGVWPWFERPTPRRRAKSRRTRPHRAGHKPDDGRVVTISLSEKGEASFAEAFRALGGDRAELLAYLDHARRHLAADRAVKRRGGTRAG